MPSSPTLARLLEETCGACPVPDPDAVSVLSGGPVHLRLHCAHAPAFTSLASAFTPYLRLTAPDDIRPQEVKVVIDTALAQRFEDLVAPGNSVLHASEPHLASEGIHLVRKQVGSPPERYSGYLLWSDGDPWTTYIVLPTADSSSHRLLLRMVRAIAARTLLAAGWIPLHAACVTTTAGAVVLLGGPASGKTTAMLYLLDGAIHPVAFVANDKVFLSPTGPVEIRALPTAVGLRAPTLRLFPELHRSAPQAAALHHDAAHDTRSRQGRTYLPAHRVAEAFAVSQSAGGTLAALIDVAYRGARHSSWRVLTPQERSAALQAAYLPDGLLDDPHEHFRLPTDHARSHHRLQRRTADIPAAAFGPGEDAARTLASELPGLLAQTARTLP